MDLRDLVQALLSHDALEARAWVARSLRSRLDWTHVKMPSGLDATGLAVAAGIAELLASRAGQAPPRWTASIGAVDPPVFLVRAAAVMPRLRTLCEQHGPEPLRSRGLLAPPEFLTAA